MKKPLSHLSHKSHLNGLDLMKSIYGEPPDRQTDLFNNPKPNQKKMKATTQFRVYSKKSGELLRTGTGSEIKNFINSHAEAEKQDFEVFNLDTDERLTVTDFIVSVMKKRMGV